MRAPVLVLTLLLLGGPYVAPGHAEETVSGLQVIELAGEQKGMSYRFGHGGNAVCQLYDVPENPRNDCLRSGEPFWGYWRGDGNGGWKWSGEGAHESEVSSGDVEGWAWGEGFDGSSHQSPGKPGEKITFESVCGIKDHHVALVVDLGEDADTYKLCVSLPVEEKEDPPPEEEEENEGGGAQPGGGRPGPQQPSSGNKPRFPGPAPKSTAVPTVDPEPDPRRLDSAPGISELELTPTPTLGEEVLPPGATAAAEEDEEGFPLAGVLALLITICMAGVAGLLLVRRRPSAPSGD